MTPEANTYEQTPGFSFASALSGSNLSDFMLGAVSTFQQGAGGYYNYTGTEGSLFVQDDWRASQTLTFNLGVRWDPYFPYNDSKNRIACYHPGEVSTRYPNAPAGLVYVGDPGCPTGTKGELGNVAPRLGFAYRLGQNPVVRGGAGLYYRLPNTDQINGVTTVAPFAPNFTLNSINSRIRGEARVYQDPFPAAFGGGNVSGSSATVTRPISINGVFPSQYYLPTVATWNLMVQRQVDVSLVVQRGLCRQCRIPSLEQRGLEAELNPAVYVPGLETVANTQSRRLNTNFRNVSLYATDFVSRYEALQLDVQKRFSRGFSVRANYTFSKLEGDFGANHCDNCGAATTNPFNRAFDWGISSTNLPNVFHLSAVSADTRVEKQRAGGYPHQRLRELSGVTNWQNGFPSRSSAARIILYRRELGHNPSRFHRRHNRSGQLRRSCARSDGSAIFQHIAVHGQCGWHVREFPVECTPKSRFLQHRFCRHEDVQGNGGSQCAVPRRVLQHLQRERQLRHAWKCCWNRELRSTYLCRQSAIPAIWPKVRFLKRISGDSARAGT